MEGHLKLRLQFLWNFNFSEGKIFFLSKLKVVYKTELVLKECFVNVLFLILYFRIIVDDPSGNSFIENPFAPAVDPTRIERHYVRSTEQVYSTQYTLRSLGQIHISQLA